MGRACSVIDAPNDPIFSRRLFDIVILIGTLTDYFILMTIQRIPFPWSFAGAEHPFYLRFLPNFLSVFFISALVILLVTNISSGARPLRGNLISLCLLALACIFYLHRSYVSVAFLFLVWPALFLGAMDLKKGMKYNQKVLGWGRAAILAAYSISGVWKLGGLGESIVNGEFLNHFLYSMAGEVFIESFMTGDPYTHQVANFLYQNPGLGFLLAGGTTMVHLSSILVFFSEGLEKYWAVAIILFHVGTIYLMNFYFPIPVAVVTALFLLKPKAIPAKKGYMRS